MFERIAVALDGSGLAELALPWASDLAAAFGSEVDIISACEASAEEHRNMHRAYVERKAEEVAGEIRSSRRTTTDHANVKGVILEGHPAEQVLEYVDKNEIGLLLLVSHGRSGLMPWSMGSTAARILERTTRPALFIRAGTASVSNRLLHLLVALDGSERSEATLPYAVEMARLLGSRVTLFRVVGSGYNVSTIGGMSYIALPKAETDRLSEEAAQYLDRVRARFGDADVKPVVCVGDAPVEIVKFAGENEVSLVVMASHGESGSGWSLGGVAHKMVHGSPVPLLLVKTSPAAPGPAHT